MTTLVWFREDLRLADNPALDFAAQAGKVAAVFIKPVGLGGASEWWLNHSLESVQNDLSKAGVSLILRQGEPSEVLPNLAKHLESDQVVWNRVYSPNGIEQGISVKTGTAR